MDAPREIDATDELPQPAGAVRAAACAQALPACARQIESDAAQGEQLLAQVSGALRDIGGSRDALAREIRGLAAYADELRRMSSDVESIAFKTSMLALNAAVEAAHPGDVGKGFAAVAREVRELAAAARETGKSIGHKVGLIGIALEQIVTINERVSTGEQAAVDEWEQHIQTVLERWRQHTQQLLADGALLRRKRVAQG